MLIIVGSANPCKIASVKETLQLYPQFASATIIGKEVTSDVSVQPFSLEEIIRGARNRAQHAFTNCDYSIGIESGIMNVPYAETGAMDISACTIFDGTRYYLGLSPAFEYPSVIMNILNKKKDVNDAFFELGFTQDRKIGNEQGSIGFLTEGRIPRKMFTQYAIMMALIPLQRVNLYIR